MIKFKILEKNKFKKDWGIEGARLLLTNILNSALLPALEEDTPCSIIHSFILVN